MSSVHALHKILADHAYPRRASVKPGDFLEVEPDVFAFQMADNAEEVTKLEADLAELGVKRLPLKDKMFPFLDHATPAPSSGIAAGLEQVPTFAESGYPKLEAAQWYGVLTAPGTPTPVIDKINREVVRILQMPEVKERFLASGYSAATSSPQEFGATIRNDLPKWAEVIKSSGMPPID